jgi:hypothetical protein
MEKLYTKAWKKYIQIMKTAVRFLVKTGLQLCFNVLSILLQYRKAEKIAQRKRRGQYIIR